MPRAGRYFVVGMSFVGLVVMFGCAGHAVRSDDSGVLLYILLTCLAALGKIELATKHGTMSLAFALVFATLLRFGAEEAAIAAALSGLLATMVNSRGFRQPWFRYTFNAGSLALAGWLTGVTYSAMGGGHIGASMERSLIPVGAGTLVYYLLNTSSVSLAICLTTGQPIFKTWRDSFLWTAPGYFAGAFCALVVNRSYSSLGLPVFLVVLPILCLTYYSYKVYSEKADEHLRHIEDLRAEQQKLSALYLSTVESLAIAIDAKDQYSHDHIRRVQKYAVETAIELGIGGDELEGIRTAALLHDIGKLGVPEHILSKPGRLSDEEKRKIQDHTTTGAKILEPVDFPWPVAQVVRSHHEQYNGGGYPDGLRGELIPLGARVLSVADVFDALTSDRPHRLAMTREKGRETIRQLAGSMFDPAVAGAFDRIVARVSREVDEEARGREAHPAVHRAGEVAEGEQASAVESSAVEDIARANQEILALYEIAQSVGTNLNLHETLGLIVSKISKIIPFTSCAVLLLDRDRGEFRAEIAQGLDADFLWRLSVREGEGLTGSVAATGLPAILSDGPGPELAVGAVRVESFALNSALVGPLIADGETLGTINLYHEMQRFFTEDHLRLLNIVSRQAAMAIKNAVLFQETRESALTDSLTGLANARYLFILLEQEISRAARSNNSLSMLVMDLDGFKPVNDQYGHAAGDRVLRELAMVLRAQLRDYDAVARYAGDEFIIVMPSASSAEAEAAAVRIKEAVDGYCFEPWPGQAVHVGMSVGFSTYPRDGMDSSTLIAVADARMYEDKRLRKTKIVGEAA